VAQQNRTVESQVSVSVSAEAGSCVKLQGSKE